MADAKSNVTVLLDRMNSGDEAVTNELLSVAYDKLRAIAGDASRDQGAVRASARNGEGWAVVFDAGDARKERRPGVAPGPLSSDELCEWLNMRRRSRAERRRRRRRC
ncbi:MAG: hypothetical protein JSS51_05275 [Planctomycetes bacterium]|nr:hypothetical protein [Planctomycetota bacterium]